MAKRICVFKSAFYILFSFILFESCVYAQPAQEKHAADWMRNVKFGVMVHYLATLQNTVEPHNMGKTTSWDSCVNDFNTDLFASQVHQTGASYVIFTVYQGTRFICTPSESYERITGYKRGEATSHRDLVVDIYNSLQKYNIKLFIYVTGDGTYRDQKANIAFNNPMLLWKQNNNKFIATPQWVNSWAGVLQEWSMRWGNKISGWWVDGAFSFHGYNDTLLGILYKALKSGNSNSVVAFNASPQKKVTFYSKWDDYTAGEMDALTDLPEPGGRINGTQWHIVSYLGINWRSETVRFKKSYLTNYINQVKERGGVVTINLALYRNGSLDTTQLIFLRKVSKGIK